MKSKFLLGAAFLMLLSASSAWADAVPISSESACCFYSLQLSGVSFGAGGENVQAFVYDNTGDPSAFGNLTVVDVTTDQTLINQTFGKYGTYGAPGTYSQDYTLPYNDLLQISMNGQEFSQMGIFYGNTLEAIGGYYDGVYPSFSIETTIPAPTPEPSSLLLLGTGLVGIVGAIRRRMMA